MENNKAVSFRVNKDRVVSKVIGNKTFYLFNLEDAELIKNGKQ